MNSLPAALRIGFLCCRGFSYITTGNEYIIPIQVTSEPLVYTSAFGT